MSFDVKVVFKDEDILCIEKPAGSLSIPDRYDPSKKNIYHYLQNRHPGVMPVHRLDKDTSGIMVWALNEQAHRSLNTQFADRQVIKHYLAIVHGNMHESHGKIDAAIAYGSSGKGMVNRKGKPSQTSWRLVEQFRDFALLEVTPHTGRTHQIRIHLQHIGHPLAVDALYGQRSALYAHDIKTQGKFNYRKGKELRPLIGRHTLHASRLIFLHPVTGSEVSFTAGLPKDFRALLNQLEKWRKPAKPE